MPILQPNSLFRIAQYFSEDHIDLGRLALAWPNVGLLNEDSSMWWFLWYYVHKKTSRSKRTSKTIKASVIKADYRFFRKMYFRYSKSRATNEVYIPRKMIPFIKQTNCLKIYDRETVRMHLSVFPPVWLQENTVFVFEGRWNTSQATLDNLRIAWNNDRIKKIKMDIEKLPMKECEIIILKRQIQKIYDIRKNIRTLVPRKVRYYNRRGFWKIKY